MDYQPINFGLGPIDMPDLDFGKIRSWVKKGKDYYEEDTVSAFIHAWIGFNHYYGTFCNVNSGDFQNWAHEHRGNHRGDKSQLLYLVNHQDFETMWNTFKELNPYIFTPHIDLPVTGMLYGNPEPPNFRGRYQLDTLTIEQIFLITYQVRNNLFHGSKDPEKNSRDFFLTNLCGSFLIPFLIELIENTRGEVRNTYNNWQW
ncbi:MAG: hypothetical protein KDD01_18620 [Phaeodactylibacter sp.]|nr:hypothetical protein [Phaeodactylibacter sp.]